MLQQPFVKIYTRKNLFLVFAFEKNCARWYFYPRKFLQIKYIIIIITFITIITIIITRTITAATSPSSLSLCSLTFLLSYKILEIRQTNNLVVWQIRNSSKLTSLLSKPIFPKYIDCTPTGFLVIYVGCDSIANIWRWVRLVYHSYCAIYFTDKQKRKNCEVTYIMSSSTFQFRNIFG